MNDNNIDILVRIFEGIGQGVVSLEFTKIVATVIGAFVPIIVSFLFIRWKNSIIHSLNEYLIHQTHPVIAFFFHLFFWIIICVCPIVFIYCVYYGLNLWIYAVGVAISVLLIRIVYKHIINKDRKGLVGLLAHDLKSVSQIENPSVSDRIHFVNILNDDGTWLSYEERTVIHDRKQIETIVNEAIVPYYDDLFIEMGGNNVNNSVFIVEGKHICNFMKEVYSADNIINHIKKVKDKMSDDNSINFIGDKIGVKGYSITKGNLFLDLYLTDHFTFNVFKSIFLEKQNKEYFQTIIRRTNIVNEQEKKLLVKSLKFLLSSFGIDIVIHGKTANKKKGMLVGLRSGRIEKSGESKLHVPVNETFTKTDIKDNRYNLYECVKRGINEELGIPSDIINDKSISFHDFALVADQGEIGLGCHVDLSETMTLEQARLYPGQDKYMEMDNLIIVPYPRFFWNPNKYIEYFYTKSYNDTFCTPWESFTPLLYQRCVVRNMELKNIRILNYFITLILNILFFYYYLPDLSDWINFLVKTIVATIYSLIFAPLLIFAIKSVFNFIISLIKRDAKTIIPNKVLFIKPLLPQWGTDVKVLQATKFSNEEINNTRNTDKNPIASDLHFCIYGHKEKPRRYKLSHLKLQVPPLCKVRRETVKNEESPISFYLFQPQREVVTKSRLFFVKVPIKSYQGKLDIDLNITFDSNKNVSYRFAIPFDANEEPELVFSESYSEEQIESFQHLFSLPRKTIKNQIRALLGSSFKSNYTPLDLFLYRGNYFWSVFEKNSKSIPKIVLDKYSIVYDDYVKDIKHDTTIRFTGTTKIVAKKISEFISNYKNRSRISALDIYMLQLALTRLGSDNMGIFLGIEECHGFSNYISQKQQIIVRCYRKLKKKIKMDSNAQE